MGDHFSLDVDADVVAAAARRLGERGDHLRGRGRTTSSAPDRWRSGWSSRTSTTVGEEARTLGGHLTTFAGKLDAAGDAVGRLAEDLAHAQGVEIPDLNRRWAAADAAYDDAVAAADARHDRQVAGIPADTPPQVRRMIRMDLDDSRTSGVSSASTARTAAQDKLTLEFDDVRDRLRRHAVRVSQALTQAVAVPVPPALVAAYRAAQGNVLAQWLWNRGGSALTDLLTAAEQQLGGPMDELAGRLQDPPDDYAGIQALLARARELGVPPDQYAPTLREYWNHRAAEVAGIDLAAWDPTLGADANRDIIVEVYEYYARLYLDHPDLQWAGMANMIGPSFAAGFFDLAQFRRIGESVGDLPPALRGAVPPGVDQLADLSVEELRFFETTFLDMQQQIFFDQGAMHQAYVDGGMAAIEEMVAAGIIPPEIGDAWADVDSGVPARVAAGNVRFLLREQQDIIDDDYQVMYDHSPTGPAMTWAMTLIGAPSIPDAQGYADVFPLTVGFDTPGPENIGTPSSIFGRPIPHVSVDNPTQVHVTVETPLPDGNIAHFDDRWALIEQDTLPRYQDLLARDPDRARAIIGSSVEDRIADYRMTERIDEIIGQMLDWDVDVDQ
ncbi:WXG100 family type VII secretion target [Nocardioides iriomotensis]|uniref:WXG100 family type VII secretion target n=1 Tax=Nocardioides iriomotensis TaxID=715784 RepID=A0A4Q5J8G1_9ACTN|nr:WXG100 family type VII secretion target [Nocardioides iriomotensis]RYU14208.1 WXG100 family type VII secretion target [Nocardioides iriomotensis]